MIWDLLWLESRLYWVTFECHGFEEFIYIQLPQVFSWLRGSSGPNLLWVFFGDTGMWDVAAVAWANLQIRSICFLSRVSLAVASVSNPPPPLCLSALPRLAKLWWREENWCIGNPFLKQSVCAHSVMMEKKRTSHFWHSADQLSANSHLCVIH